MKNRKLLISTISAVSAATVTLPLVVTAVGCSCHKKTQDDKFDGEDVNEEIYTPVIDTLGGGKINLTEGTTKYWEYLVNHTNMPYEEFKWSSSSWASVIKSLIKKFVGEDKELVKFNKWTAKLSDFTINDQATKRVSYTITQDIDMDVDIYQEKKPNASSLKSIKGHIRLAWCNKITNVPVGCFDFDPSGMLGETIYKDETLWYIAPDLSSIEPDDDTWSINYDILPDIHLTINDAEVVNLNNEFIFNFDKTMAGLIESAYSKEDLPVAYFIERMIGLLAGWNSYYLSQTAQFDHIDWSKSQWDSSVEISDIGAATTSFGKQSPIYNYKIVDKAYGKDDLYTGVIGLNMEAIDTLDYLSVISLNSRGIKYNVESFDTTNQMLKVSYDFMLNPHLGRWPDGTTFTALRQTGLCNADVFIPYVATKDWMSIGGISDILGEGEGMPDLIMLQEKSVINEIDAVSKKISTNGTGKATISFEIKDEEVYKHLTEDSKATKETKYFRIYPTGCDEEETTISLVCDEQHKQGFDTTKDDNKMYLNVYVKDSNWPHENPDYDYESPRFNILLQDKSNNESFLQFEEYSLVNGSEYLSWNRDLDSEGRKVLVIGSDGHIDNKDWDGFVSFSKVFNKTSMTEQKVVDSFTIAEGWGASSLVIKNADITWNEETDSAIGDKWSLTINDPSYELQSNMPYTISFNIQYADDEWHTVQFSNVYFTVAE